MENTNQLISQTEEKTYNLKNDIIFQAFFARKGNEQFLIDFLNALLKMNIKNIEIREEVNLERLSKEEKGGRLDLQAKLEDGTIVSIEMQMRDEGNFKERTTMYAGKVESRESKKGTNYEDISQIIMINILGFNLLEVEDYISETAIVLNKHRDYEILTGIKWYFIELPKFREIQPDMNEKINQWLAFIDDNNKELVNMAENKNETLKKAREEMNYLTGDAELRRLAELREKWEMDRISAISHATKIGKEEGIKERNKGTVKKNGKKEEKINVAKKLLKMKMTVEQVEEATGLTKKEIEEIKKDI